MEILGCRVRGTDGNLTLRLCLNCQELELCKWDREEGEDFQFICKPKRRVGRIDAHTVEIFDANEEG